MRLHALLAVAAASLGSVCNASGYATCVTTYLPNGTSAVCTNDYNTGVATPFYAVCR